MGDYAGQDVVTVGYGVRLVADDVMPAGHDWVVVSSAGKVTAYVRRSTFSGRVLAEAWAAYRRHPGIRAA